MVLLVVSCDKYEVCWKPFFGLLKKYYPNHPKTYLVTESKKCPYCKTINVEGSWTQRLKKALERLNDDVLIMLDDFFIRGPVDEERIKKLRLNEQIACFNFEQEHREPLISLKEWDIQKNGQVYLNSCQPSLWNRKVLIDRLEGDKTPQEWELTIIDSPYIHFINNKDLIIDIGVKPYGWGITGGKFTTECLEFLESEGYDVKHNNPLL